MLEANAILFDVRSIQKYIFGGNKLRTNIGASHIADIIFEEVLIKGVLESGCNWLGSVDTTSWKKIAEQMEDSPNCIEEANDRLKQILKENDCIIATVGGGKALLLCRLGTEVNDNNKLKNIVRLFNKFVLEKYPGIHTGAAIGKFDMDNYMVSFDELFKVLKQNQSTIYPLVNPSYSGLTHFCETSGEMADYYDSGHIIDTNKKNTPRWYSHEILAKAQAAKESNPYLQELFSEKCHDRVFPLDFNRLGQNEGENYYAIVHIDGNKMGVRFRNCKSLAEYNKLVISVQKQTERAFGELLEYINTNYERFQKEGGLNLDGTLLPIRPLILGGDDVTFVCAAKIAVELAEKYMQIMLTPKDKKKYAPLYTCAGISILPTSYPFFRGYQMTEQLCGAAKSKSREQDSCWLDFGILHGEQAPTLAQIRQQEYGASQGNMHFGPYRVDNTEQAESICNLFKCVEILQKKDKDNRQVFPTNKLKEMRSVIAKDKHAISSFLEQLSHDEIAFPDVPAWEDYKEKLWHEERTPYIDAIEMVDFIVPNRGKV